MKTKAVTPAEKKACYSVLTKAAKKGHALNTAEVAESLKASTRHAGAILKALEGAGTAHVVGKDGKHPAWWPGAKVQGLFSNPSPGVMLHGPHASAQQRQAAKRAEEAARRWYQDPALTTKAKALKSWTPPLAFVEVGTIVSICYQSEKYDGKSRDWEHEFTKKRRLFISPDGSTMVVYPPFQFTSQGIKG